MQNLILYLLRLLSPRYRLSPHVAEYWSHASRVGRTARIPTELIPLATRLWARGWWNRQFLDSHREWVLPYWATRQLDPTDRGFVERALQPVLINAGYRNWTTIGNPERRLEAIVDPRGLVTPQPNGREWSLDAWLGVEGQWFFPSRLAEGTVQQSLFENLPLVQTQYEPARLRMLQEAFAVQDKAGGDWVISAYTVANPRGEPRRATFYAAVRPFNPEGLAVIERIECRPGKEAAELWINGIPGAVLPPPAVFGGAAAAMGDVAHRLEAPGGGPEITDAAGLATAVAAYELELPPHSHRVVTVALPMAPGAEPSAEAHAWVQPDALGTLKREFSARWRRLLGEGMSIRVPDDAVQNAFEANKAYLLLLHDGDSITPGPFLYHEFWFRDAAFLLHALDQLGYHEQVKQVLRSYPRSLRKDGYFQAQDGEWDANGAALWTIEQHTRLSGDFEVIHALYWDLLNAAHWIDAARQTTKGRGEPGPAYGLLPAGLSAEHLGPDDSYYWDDWWGLAGLRAACFAAALFNNTADREKLTTLYQAFRGDVEASLARAAEKNHAQWMPAAPERGADSAMVANLIASYPLQLVAPDDPRVMATIEELKRDCFVDGAFFHHVGHGGFGTYLALHLAGSEVFQRRSGAWDAMRFLLKHASPTWTWAEAIHPLTRRGGHGDGHHGWMAADLISFIRNALLFEEGDHLVLTPALPDDWVFETASIKVERAATYFGDVEFTLAFGDRNATLVLKGKWREPPAWIEWNLPVEIKEAGGDKAGVERLDAHRVRIPANVQRVVATW